MVKDTGAMGERGSNFYAAELREIAGMLAQSPDGPLRWKQYRLVAVADYLSSLAHSDETAKLVEGIQWRPIAELDDLYRQPIWIASPKLIHGDSNPLGIADAYWQDTTGPEQGEWRTTSFDMCNDEWDTITLAKEDVTHFAVPNGPLTALASVETDHDPQ